MALLRKLFYRKPPDGLFEISERVFVFDCCFTIDALEEKDYKRYVGGIVAQLREQYPDASILVFNFREGDRESSMAKALSEYDMTIMEYPRQYEGVPVLLMEVIHHFLRSSESWLSLGLQNLLLMHCERGGWPVLAFMLAALLIYRKQYNVEHKTLDMVYKQAPRELLQMLSPINPLPSQLRYLQYISRRNVAAEWPPKERALTMDCVIIRTIPNFDGHGGCRPIFRLYGQDPLLLSDRAPKVLFSTPKKSRTVLHYKQAECELIKIDINCLVQGDVVMECISLDDGLDREKIMFRVMFNTAFIRSNILMLGREEIDMLWDGRDRFSKDFRAEVLFSDINVAAAVLPMEHSCFEEKDGLPEEAFAKVQEIFSSVDWLIPKGDAAVEVLQQMGLSCEVLETYSQSAKFHQEIKSLEALEHGVKDTSDPTSQNEFSFSTKLTPNADMCITQAQSQLSGIMATVPVAKGGFPTVLYDLKDPNSGVAERVGPETHKSVPGASPDTFLIPPMDLDGFSPGEPLTPPLEEKTRTTSGVSPTSAPYAGTSISLDSPSKNEAMVREGTPSSPATSYLIHDEETKDRPSEPMPCFTTSSSEDVVETPRTDSLISPLTSPSTIASIKNMNRVAIPPPPPSPPLTSSASTTEEQECTRINPSFPASISPSTQDYTQATGGRQTPPPLSSLSSHTTDTTFVTTTSKHPEFPKTITHPSVEETSVMAQTPSLPEPPCSISPVKEESLSSPLPPFTPPLLNKSARKHAPPPPPPPPLPPKTTSAHSSPPPTLSPKEPSSPGVVSQPDPSLPLKKDSGTKSTPPPPPPPPSTKDSSSLSGAPVPPPPPPPPSTKDSSSLSGAHVPPPPPPPPSTKNSLSLSGAPVPPPPPPLSGKGEVKPSPSPPPPPPTPAKFTGPATSGSPSPPVPSAPPPPFPFNKDSTASASSNNCMSGYPSPPPPLAPPPGGKGKPLLSRTITSKNSQSKKLKPLHWLKLSRAVSGSLWAEAQKPGDTTKAPEIDLSELESLFSATVPNADQGAKDRKNSSRASVNKVEKVQLIDLRRAYNCEIMLSKVKIPLHDLLSSVLALEDNALDVDQVDNLIKFCPTKEEMELLKGYTGDRNKLGKCEQFFLELMKVPRIESKLRVFSFKIQFTTQVSDLRKNLIVVTSAADQIRGSAKLKRIMQTILSLGNALNQGTARGSAIGFRLDSLLKLTETRARNNRMTLMHYLCKVIADKLPEVLDFPQELSSLEPASKVQLKYLAEEMQAINKGLEKVMQELAMSENDGPVSDQFRKALKEFLSFSEGEVRSLASLYSGVGRNVDALILYFGEDPARCPFEQVISTLLNFTRMFKNALEDNRKQLELERKQSEKEASTEKLIRGAPEKMLDAR